MRRVDGARLAAEESLREIMRVPEVEVADLRPLDADDAEDVACRHAEASGIPRRHDHLGDFRHSGSQLAIEPGVIGREAIARVDRDRGGGTTRGGIRRRWRLGWGPHGDVPFVRLQTSVVFSHASTFRARLSMASKAVHGSHPKIAMASRTASWAIACVGRGILRLFHRAVAGDRGEPLSWEASLSSAGEGGYPPGTREARSGISEAA